MPSTRRRPAGQLAATLLAAALLVAGVAAVCEVGDRVMVVSAQPAASVTAGSAAPFSLEVRSLTDATVCALFSGEEATASLVGSPGGVPSDYAETSAVDAGAADFAGFETSAVAAGLSYNVTYTLEEGGEQLSLTTSAFDVVPGPFARLRFTTMPTGRPAGSDDLSGGWHGQVWEIQPVVEAQDDEGNPVGSAVSGTVECDTLLNDGPDDLTVLGGTTTQPAVDGVTTFTDLFVSGPPLPGDVRVTCVSNFTGEPRVERKSPFFAVDLNGPPAQIAIVQDGSNVTQGSLMTPAVVVELQAAGGEAVTTGGYSGSVVLQGTGEVLQTGIIFNELGRASFGALQVTVPGTYRLLAVAVSPGGTVTVNSTAAEHSDFTVLPSPEPASLNVTFDSETAGLTVGGIPFADPPVVSLLDAAGRLVEFPFDGQEVTASVSVVSLDAEAGVDPLALTGGSALVSGGTATFEELTINRAGVYTLTFTAGEGEAWGPISFTTANVTLTVGELAALRVEVQPGAVPDGDTSAEERGGEPFTVQPRVLVVDSGSNIVRDLIGAECTASLNDPAGNGGGLFSRNPSAVDADDTTVVVANGTAQFAGLRIDLEGENYTLSFVLETYPGTLVESRPIRIVGGGSTDLRFNNLPGAQVAAEPWAGLEGSVIILLTDAGGNVAGDSDTIVDLALASGPEGGTLSGVTSKRVDAGVVTFSELSIDRVGTYTLEATALPPTLGDGTVEISAISGNITILLGPAAKMNFDWDQEESYFAGDAFASQPSVTLVDRGNNIVSEGSDTETVEITVSVNPGGSVLSGTTEINFVAGVATFTDLSLNRPGTGYRLSAITTADIETPLLTSEEFDIEVGPSHELRFTTQPQREVISQRDFTVAPEVSVFDVAGNLLVADEGTNVTLAVFSFDPPIGESTTTEPPELVGEVVLPTFNGSVAFPGLRASGFASNVRLEASGNFSLAEPGATHRLAAVSEGTDVILGTATNLVVTQQPSGGPAGVPWDVQPVVELRDDGGNVIVGENSLRLRLFVYDPDDGFFEEDATQVGEATADDGVFTFSGVSHTRTGTFTVRAAAVEAPFDVDTDDLEITLGLNVTLRFIETPPSHVAAQPWSELPRLGRYDAFGNPDLSDNTTRLRITLIDDGTGEPADAGAVAYVPSTGAPGEGDEELCTGAGEVLVTLDRGEVLIGATVGRVGSFDLRAQAVVVPVDPVDADADADADADGGTGGDAGTATGGDADGAGGNSTEPAACPLDDDGAAVLSSVFEIVLGAPHEIVVEQEPVAAPINVVWPTQPQFSVRDLGGNLYERGAGLVASLELTHEAGAGPVLRGSGAAAVGDDGWVRFDDVAVDTVGVCTLTVALQVGDDTDPLVGAFPVELRATTAEATVLRAVPTSAVFDVSPGSGVARRPLSGASPRILLLDELGDVLVADSESVVLVELRSETGGTVRRPAQTDPDYWPGAGRLFGTTERVLALGAVEFPDLQVDRSGSYTLVGTVLIDQGPFERPLPIAATSEPFSVSKGVPHELVFARQPRGGPAERRWDDQPRVAVVDQGGNLVTADTGLQGGDPALEVELHTVPDPPPLPDGSPDTTFYLEGSYDRRNITLDGDSLVQPVAESGVAEWTLLTVRYSAQGAASGYRVRVFGRFPSDDFAGEGAERDLEAVSDEFRVTEPLVRPVIIVPDALGNVTEAMAYAATAAVPVAATASAWLVAGTAFVPALAGASPDPAARGRFGGWVVGYHGAISLLQYMQQWIVTLENNPALSDVFDLFRLQRLFQLNTDPPSEFFSYAQSLAPKAIVALAVVLFFLVLGGGHFVQSCCMEFALHRWMMIPFLLVLLCPLAESLVWSVPDSVHVGARAGVGAFLVLALALVAALSAARRLREPQSRSFYWVFPEGRGTARAFGYRPESDPDIILEEDAAGVGAAEGLWSDDEEDDDDNGEENDYDAEGDLEGGRRHAGGLKGSSSTASVMTRAQRQKDRRRQLERRRRRQQATAGERFSSFWSRAQWQCRLHSPDSKLMYTMERLEEKDFRRRVMAEEARGRELNPEYEERRHSRRLWTAFAYRPMFETTVMYTPDPDGLDSAAERARTAVAPLFQFVKACYLVAYVTVAVCLEDRQQLYALMGVVVAYTALVAAFAPFRNPHLQREAAFSAVLLAQLGLVAWVLDDDTKVWALLCVVLLQLFLVALHLALGLAFKELPPRAVEMFVPRRRKTAAGGVMSEEDRAEAEADADHYLRLARIYWETGGQYRTDHRYAYTHFAHAAKLFQAVSADDPRAAEPLCRLGMIHMIEDRQSSKARRLLRAALRLSPGMKDAGHRLAAYHLRQQQPEKAAAVLDRAVLLAEGGAEAGRRSWAQEERQKYWRFIKPFSVLMFNGTPKPNADLGALRESQSEAALSVGGGTKGGGGDDVDEMAEEAGAVDADEWAMVAEDDAEAGVRVDAVEMAEMKEAGDSAGAEQAAAAPTSSSGRAARSRGRSGRSGRRSRSGKKRRRHRREKSGASEPAAATDTGSGSGERTPPV